MKPRILEKKGGMFSPWELVRPTLWHPLSMLELSMMDASTLPQLSTSLGNVPGVSSDEDFFKDLPMTDKQEEKKQPTPETENQGAFSSYAFSSSSVLDEDGHKVMSTRRRYEDSTGRLKAEHEREVLGKHLKTVWNRKKLDEEGEHHIICSQGTPDEFEKLWSQTAFGKAQEKKLEKSVEQPKQVEKAPTNKPE